MMINQLKKAKEFDYVELMDDQLMDVETLS